MELNYKKKLLLGVSLLGLGVFVPMSFAQAQDWGAWGQGGLSSQGGGGDGSVTTTTYVPATCDAVQSRTVTCLDYRGGVVADSYCMDPRAGAKPDANQDCSYECGQNVTTYSSSGGDGGDGGDGETRSGFVGGQYVLVTTDKNGNTDITTSGSLNHTMNSTQITNQVKSNISSGKTNIFQSSGSSSKSSSSKSSSSKSSSSKSSSSKSSSSSSSSSKKK